MVPDTLATAAAGADTWPSLIRHIFDSVWGTVGAAVGSLLLGWLVLKRPGDVSRKDPTPVPEANDHP
jgi:hypothetical protein